MKEKILKIIDKLSEKDYLYDCEVQLIINYEDLRNYKDVKNILFIDAIDELKILINNFSGKIEGYNLTLEKRNYKNLEHTKGWKSVTYTFWSGNDEDLPKIDTLKYGMFEWIFLSDMESFDSNGIRNKLSKYTYTDEYDDHPRIDHGNYFDYDNIENVINSLIELDILINKQYKEKCKIYDKIRLYI